MRRGSQIFWAGHEPGGAAWWIPHRPPSSRIRNRPHISRNTCAATNSSGWHSNFLSSLIILISKHDGNDPIISLTNLLANKKPMTCYVYHIYWYRANKYVCNSLDPYRCVSYIYFLKEKKKCRERDRVRVGHIMMAYPEVDLWGLLLWNSISSTVQTAPLTFSTRMKHLCSDRLWRTAF